MKRDKTKMRALEHRVGSQAKEIARLHEKIQGYEELMNANNAIVAAVLHAVGADKDKPIQVEKDVISKAVKHQCVAVSEYKVETPEVYWLHYEEFPESENKE